MAPNFSKNAILEGDIDFFCLVCEAHIKSTSECEAHISNGQHDRNFVTTNYVKEFPGDFIRKIKSKYFCEVCNKILLVLPRVRLHVNEPSHIEKKNVGALKRFADVVIAFDELAINNYTWHSLCENSCAICNTECEDLDEHSILPSHILNLLQTKVEFDNHRNIYRKIDEYSFQCLTCNLVHNLNNIKTHFESQAHRELYQVCLDACKPLKEDMQRLNNLKSYPKSNDTTPESIIINNSINTKKSEETTEVNTKGLATSETKVHVNEVKPTNDVKENIKTNSIPDLPKTSEAKEKPKSVSTYHFDEEIEKKTCKILNTKNYITRDENNQTWCILCDWIMDTFRIREHINGKHHHAMLKLHKKRIEKLKLQNLNIVNEEINAKINNIQLTNSAEEFKKNHINIDTKSKIAYCKKCSIKLDYDYDAINKHILDHNNPQQEDARTGQRSFIFQVRIDRCFGENLYTSQPVFVEREFVLESTDTDSDDTVTEVEVKSHSKPNTDVASKKETQSEESQSEEPQGEVGEVAPNQMKKPKSTPETISSKEYIENVMAVKNIIYRDVIINEKLCINHFSFLFMIFLIDKVNMKCYVCDENITCRDFKDHCAKEKHELAVKEAPVVSHLDSEFIREMRPGHFHCGFCNIYEKSWEEMEVHLTSSDHKDCKNDSSWRLQKYQPEIAIGNYEKTVADVFYSNIINGNFF